MRYFFVLHIALWLLAADAAAQCFGGIFREHNSDLAWENDRVAFRAYGPESQQKGENLFGYDLFMKRTSRPVLREWYAKQFDPAIWHTIDSLRAQGISTKHIEDSITFHIDHGEGADFYSVGPTLSAGTNAIFEDGQIIYPYCYEKVEILQNKPDIFEAHLIFKPVVIGCDSNVVEHRIISLRKGDRLTKATVWYDNLNHDTDIAVGIRNEKEECGENGTLWIGCAYPQKPDSVITHHSLTITDHKPVTHRLAITHLPKGARYTYYFGYGWSKNGFVSEEQWKTYLKHLEDSVAKTALCLTPVGLGYANTSVNATIFRKNSIISQGEWQFVAYYDAEGRLTLGKRKIGSEHFEVQTTQYTGKVTDAHNVISIMLDGEGYLHVAFDHHGGRLRYCRSVAPYSLQLGPLESMTGRDEDDVTYPEFYTLRDGNLLFAYRSGMSGCGNLVLNRYDTKQRRWSRVHDVLISGEGQRNAYWQMCTDRKGVIHLSWVWRETWAVETNHDLCYAKSLDGGRTWRRSDGTPYALPITAETAEYACRIPQGSELINQTSMGCDTKGYPYIATYWRDKGDSIPQYRLVWYDPSAKWQQRQVSHRTMPFSLSGGGTKMIPISRPCVMIDKKNIYYIYRDKEQGSKAMMLTAPLKGKDALCFTSQTLTDFSVDAWEPSVDTELFKRSGMLDIYLQTVHQGDGERQIASPPEYVYVLEPHVP